MRQDFARITILIPPNQEFMGVQYMVVILVSYRLATVDGVIHDPIWVGSLENRFRIMGQG